MIAGLGKSREGSPAKIKMEEDCDEIHDYLVLSHWKHS
jgi:hypothetical protein